MPTDRFKPGNIVKALIADITEDAKGNSRVVLSRTDPNFIAAIIKNEIPEVENGLVIINKIVRDPGSRSKVLVSAIDGENIDPVGAILGKKNMRIINIIRQVSNTMQEKIDIIEYQPQDLDLMIMDALEPAQIERVEIKDDGVKADVYCYKDEAALAVGRRGVNIRLASELLGVELNLITFEDDGTNTKSNESEMPAIILE
jgi:N utilization substance protein A